MLTPILSLVSFTILASLANTGSLEQYMYRSNDSSCSKEPIMFVRTDDVPACSAQTCTTAEGEDEGFGMTSMACMNDIGDTSNLANFSSIYVVSYAQNVPGCPVGKPSEAFMGTIADGTCVFEGAMYQKMTCTPGGTIRGWSCSDIGCTNCTEYLNVNDNKCSEEILYRCQVPKFIGQQSTDGSTATARTSAATTMSTFQIIPIFSLVGIFASLIL
jgi:hypothetical protein